MGPLKILNGIKMILDDQGNQLDSYWNQFGIIQDLQRSPIPQTSNWSGTFFAVSYSKLVLLLVRLSQLNHLKESYKVKNSGISQKNLSSVNERIYQ